MLIMYTCFQNFRVHIQNQVTTILTILAVWTDNFEIRLKMTLAVIKKIMISFLVTVPPLLYL
jgi:hypothetical protein